MKDRIRLLQLPAYAIVDYLASGRKTNGVKEYELLLAVGFCDFCEIQFKQPCNIAFELQQKYWDSLPKTETFDLDQLEVILNEQIEQTSEIDFGIACGSKVVSFQVKRFGKGRTDTSGTALAEYISTQRKRYGGLRKYVTLLLVLDGAEDTDTDELFNALDIGNDFPFSRIMFFYRDRETKREIIGEFWPRRGSDAYVFVNGRLTLYTPPDTAS